MLKFLLLSTLLFSFSSLKAVKVQSDETKIKGINFVSPTKKVSANCVISTKRINANWIALCPYAFMSPNNPNVEYDVPKNWWGDKPEGISKLTVYAKANNQKVLLKPHFWVDQQGWPGDFNLDAKNWKLWENNYLHHILKLARLADSLNIDMLSIGAEFKTATQKRPQFWSGLIDSVRKVYQGKLIYAANWDEFDKISFWNKLDYIGIDAYFPISEEVTPTKEKMEKQWERISTALDFFSKKHKKKIIFTEYGYRSIDKCAWKQWEVEDAPVDKNVNMLAQQNAYEALFNVVWKKNWFAGGFLWKWYPKDNESGGIKNSDYTPQNKPSEEIIKKWYLAN
jgi:hypothetical protein